MKRLDFRIFILLLVISSCHNNKKIPNVVPVKDMLGRTVNVPGQVSKVVGVNPGALRLISYLDAADRVVGVEEIEKRNNNPYNMANPGYKNLPVIGPMHGGDAELIAITKPDVIFMTYATSGNADKLQTQTGIPVVALHYGDLDENKEVFYEALNLVAKVIHKQDRADSLISQIENTIDDLNGKTKGDSLHSNKVYVGGISFRGSHGITSTEPGFAPFRFVNAKNVASGISSANNNAFIDKEQLIEWNPDKIFIDYTGWDIVQKDIGQEVMAQTLKAVKNNEIYLLLPYNWYTTNYETVLVNAYFTGTILYPDTFKEINFEDKANEIYSLFLGKSIYDQMTIQFGHPGKVKKNY